MPAENKCGGENNNRHLKRAFIAFDFAVLSGVGVAYAIVERHRALLLGSAIGLFATLLGFIVSVKMEERSGRTSEGERIPLFHWPFSNDPNAPKAGDPYIHNP